MLRGKCKMLKYWDIFVTFVSFLPIVYILQWNSVAIQSIIKRKKSNLKKKKKRKEKKEEEETP